MSNNKQKGFSLVESLISLLIMSVVISASIPLITIRHQATSTGGTGTGSTLYPYQAIQQCDSGTTASCAVGYNNGWNQSCSQVLTAWPSATSQSYNLSTNSSGAYTGTSCTMTSIATAAITGCTNGNATDCAYGYKSGYNQSCSQIASSWLTSTQTLPTHGTFSLSTSSAGASSSSTCSVASSLTLLKTFTFTGAAQTFTAPYTGTYKLEAWGAQGGANGGLGGYTYGNVALTAGSQLTIIVGGEGNLAPNNNTASEYNAIGGGGSTNIYAIGGSPYYMISGGGGGVSLGGGWPVAGGAGGGGGASGSGTGGCQGYGGGNGIGGGAGAQNCFAGAPSSGGSGWGGLGGGGGGCINNTCTGSGGGGGSYVNTTYVTSYGGANGMQVGNGQVNISLYGFQ